MAEELFDLATKSTHSLRTDSREMSDRSSGDGNFRRVEKNGFGTIVGEGSSGQAPGNSSPS